MKASRMASLASTLLVASSLWGATAIAPANAAASESGVAKAGACATKVEYRKVKQGQSFDKVKDIFGGRPSINSRDGSFRSAGWVKCGTSQGAPSFFLGACIHFKDNEVRSKSWYTQPTTCN